MLGSPDENRSAMGTEAHRPSSSRTTADQRPGLSSRVAEGPSSRGPGPISNGLPGPAAVAPTMNPSHAQNVTAALALIPGGRWVMTAHLEGKRGGVLVRSVSVCAEEPPLIAVAAWKGHGIEPMIRDSRHFCVCLIDPEDRLLARKFTGHLSDHADQFDSLPTQRLVSGSPALKRSHLAIDCEVVRHIDVEADHELYVGLVLATMVEGNVSVRPPDPKR